MKKSLFAYLLILILVFSACGSDIVAQGGVVVRNETDEPTDITGYYANEDIVYVTESGTKYHKQDCSYLTSSKIPVSLEQAIQEGKKPCSRCFPDD
ncbi:MAG: hypothetical protein PHO15_06820 [Eubacteriales bacterium]|nr:hypothetical protein [Eubacteriales bacterium]